MVGDLALITAGGTSRRTDRRNGKVLRHLKIRNKKRAVALGLAATLLVAACSEVDTELTIDADLSGQRVMSVSLSESDFDDKVTGTASDVNAIIDAALPSELTSTPLTLSDGSYSTTFTLAFSSPDDYVTKAQAVLDQGDDDIDAEIEILVSDSPFAEGIYVEENFTSIDLLAWLRIALVEGGAVSSSDADSMFENGTTVVIFQGEEESTGARISLDTRSDGGVSGVSMETEYAGDDQWQRTLTFTMSDDSYERQEDVVAEFFSDNLPSGAIFNSPTKSGYSYEWSVELATGTPSEIEAATNQLFLTDDTVFEVTQSAASDGRAGLVMRVEDSVDCSQLCSPYASTPTDTLVVPADWELEWEGSDAYPVDEEVSASQSAYTLDATGSVALFVSYFQIERIDVDVKVERSGDVGVEIAYLVDSEVAQEYEQALAQALQGDAETIEVNSGSETWEFKLDFPAASPATTEAYLDTYLPGSSLTFYDLGGAFSSNYKGVLYLPLSQVVGTATVSQGINYSASFPALQSATSQQSLISGCESSLTSAASNAVSDMADLDFSDLDFSDLDFDDFGNLDDFMPTDLDQEQLWCGVILSGGQVLINEGSTDSASGELFAFAGSGMTMLALILLIALAVLLLGGAVVLFLMRHKIKEKREEKKAAKQERQEAEAAAQLVAVAAPVAPTVPDAFPAPAAAPVPVPGAAPVPAPDAAPVPAVPQAPLAPPSEPVPLPEAQFAPAPPVPPVMPPVPQPQAQWEPEVQVEEYESETVVTQEFLPPPPPEGEHGPADW